MDNVIQGNFITTLDVPVEKVLGAALKDELEQVVIIGVDSDGEIYLASSKGPESTLWLLELGKKELLDFD